MPIRNKQSGGGIKERSKKVRSKLLLSTVALLLVASLAVGCATPAAPAPALAPAPTPSVGSGVYGGSQQAGIWVSGTGEVTVTPDIATLRLGIEAQEASVAEAQAKASEAMNNVMTALTDSVAEKDIQTQYFSIRQRTTWDQAREEEVVVGYRVTNRVVAKIRDMDKVASIIDAVVQAGGDFIRIDNLGFSVDDPSVYYEEAREKAIADAKAKAEQLAELVGVTLGKPTYVAEGIQQPFYPAWAGGGMAPPPAPAPAPSISPGEMTVSLSVQIAYSILQ